MRAAILISAMLLYFGPDTELPWGLVFCAFVFLAWDIMESVVRWSK